MSLGVSGNILLMRRREESGWGDWVAVPAQSLWRERSSPCRPNSDALPVYK
jgi:hypothetical protein